MNKTIALIGAGAPKEAIDNLSKDFEVFVLPRDGLIAKEISYHPDMILSVIGDKLFCHETYYNKNKRLLDTVSKKGMLNIIASRCTRNSTYPNDIAFNVLNCNNTVLAKKANVCPEMHELPITDTKQGYAGCTALYAADHVVSADPSIIKSAEGAGIPTYRISGKDIQLDGYNTGFIGGACGVFGDNIYICGDYRKSQSGLELFEFCKQFSLCLIPIYSGNVCDIGGIKFINTAVENNGKQC